VIIHDRPPNSALQRTSARSHVFLASRSSGRAEASELGTLGDGVHDTGDMVEQYFAHLRRAAESTEPAWDRVQSLVHDQPEEALAFGLDALSRAPDDWIVTMVGIDLFETLLANHPEFSERVAELALSNARLFAALESCYLDDEAEQLVQIVLQKHGRCFKSPSPN
jgi:hypothetical protein